MHSLVIRGITKAFDGQTVLDGASAELQEGVRYGLVGSNGSGKTTLVRVISGHLRADSGDVELNASTITGLTPPQVLKRGIATFHQGAPLVATLTVRQNVFLGRTDRFYKPLPSLLKDAFDQFYELLREGERVAELDPMQEFAVHICRLLLWEPAVLILDESTAHLKSADLASVYDKLSPVLEDGLSLVIVSHARKELESYCDAWLHLDNGQLNELTAVPSPRTFMPRTVPPKLSSVTSIPANDLPRPGSSSQLSLDAIQVFADSAPISLVHRPHDFTVLQADSPRYAAALFAALAGWRQVCSGTLTLGDTTFDSWNPQILRRHGVACIASDPSLIAFDTLTVAENVIYTHLAHLARAALLSRKRTVAFTERIIAAHGVRAPGPLARFSTLSGGNKQKTVLARELEHHPKAIFAHEPTSGL